MCEKIELFTLEGIWKLGHLIHFVHIDGIRVTDVWLCLALLAPFWQSDIEPNYWTTQLTKVGNHLRKNGKAPFQVYWRPIKFRLETLPTLELGWGGVCWGEHSSSLAPQPGCWRVKTSVLGFPFLGQVFCESRDDVSEALIMYFLKEWRKLGSITWSKDPDLFEPVFLSAYTWISRVISVCNGGNLLLSASVSPFANWRF